MTYSHMGTPTLPSAQLRFTSEFGMDSGGTTMLWSLDKFVKLEKTSNVRLMDINTLPLHATRTPKYLGVVWLSLTGN